MMSDIRAPKKLIEVALPLDDINAAAVREKSIRRGHPSTLHLWWARRPLAAARAVLFASLVNDPGGQRGYYAGKPKAQADAERDMLFDIIRDLVKWENLNEKSVLERARTAIRKSWEETCELNKGKLGFCPTKLPVFHDPFAGGGSIPLEAQRLGLESIASDLNPVAVTINKAMTEIPPCFANRKPVGPVPENYETQWVDQWLGAGGLAEDIRRYGRVLNQRVFEEIGHYYPKVQLDESFGGGEATVLAWLWSRTVTSPNPAAQGTHVPLISSFFLCNKKGKEVYIEPIVNGLDYHFEIRRGAPETPKAVRSGTKVARGANFRCLITNALISADYVKNEGRSGRMDWKLMAIVAEGHKGRAYAAATKEHEALALSVKPVWRPEFPLSTHPQYMSVTNYGPIIVADLFMPRQTMALVTFYDGIHGLHGRIKADAVAAGWSDDNMRLSDGGNRATAYADAILIYLGLGVSRLANRQSTNSCWHKSGEKVEHVFPRHAIPMVWDTAEGNPFSSSSGNFLGQLDYLAKSVETLPASPWGGFAYQCDARSADYENQIISMDPPYYDNVPYADLSDFFYVWLRYSLRYYLPDLFSTILVPKNEELVADHKRHAGKDNADQFFMGGMTAVMHNISTHAHAAFPVTIYYAFRQSETSNEGTVSTGWESFLEAVIKAGFAITGTWPIRTEAISTLKKKMNALASSIVLVCRRRETGCGEISRRDFQRQLRDKMPEALEAIIGGRTGQTSIAPVDLAQSGLGPGIAIFSNYEAVLNADGSPMSVNDALILINRIITEYLSPESDHFDAETHFCSSWFDQYGWSTGPFGEADILSRAKGTSVDSVQATGVLESGGGKVSLLKWREYVADWDPTQDNQTSIWEACHQLIRRLNNQGESSAGELLAKMPEKSESIRQLAYYLYILCERKQWADDARSYNELIGSWPAIIAASNEIGHRGTQIVLAPDH